MRIALVFVALAAVVVVACQGNVFSLEVGDCFNDPKDGFEEVLDVEIVECSASHDNEVYAIADYPASDDATYPGMRTLEAYAEELCVDRFEGYVGAPYEHSRLEVAYFSPVAEGWDLLDDREITCFLWDPNFVKLVGSQKGSGK